MGDKEPIRLSRDCEVAHIPGGTKGLLPKGTQVFITQSLGGTTTVLTGEGYLVSIAGKDADALGRKPEEAPKPDEGQTLDDSAVEKMVWTQLRKCYDPEIPHNIVDLGLVYECRISTLFPSGGRRVDIKMTLTAPGCGMGDWLKRDVEEKVSSVPGVEEANVEIVFDPPWNPGMMNEALRRDLNLM